MKWTKEVPTKAGWYWWKDSVNEPQLYKFTPPFWEPEFDEKFAGPIEEPEE